MVLVYEFDRSPAPSSALSTKTQSASNAFLVQLHKVVTESLACKFSWRNATCNQESLHHIFNGMAEQMGDWTAEPKRESTF
jgi:hypothetical protein